MKNITILPVTSLDHLKEDLGKIPPGKKLTAPYISLAVSDERIHLCSFYMNDTTKDRIYDRLCFEAVQLLNLPVDEIILDYMLFDSSENEYSGLFICTKKEDLLSYIHTIDQSGFIPLIMTTVSLVRINNLNHQGKIGNENVCLLDFSEKDRAYLAILSERKCYFYREISYDTIPELKQEIKQSIRSTCSRSVVKQIDKILYFGTSLPEINLQEDFKESFGVTIENVEIEGDLYAMDFQDKILRVNLFRPYSFSFPTRKKLELARNAALILVGLFMVYFTFQRIVTEYQLNKLKSSYTQSEYQRALDLKQKAESK